MLQKISGILYSTYEIIDLNLRLWVMCHNFSQSTAHFDYKIWLNYAMKLNH